jgi:hypothetical protein
MHGQKPCPLSSCRTIVSRNAIRRHICAPCHIQITWQTEIQLLFASRSGYNRRHENARVHFHVAPRAARGRPRPVRWRACRLHDRRRQWRLPLAAEHVIRIPVRAGLGPALFIFEL